MYRPDDTQKMVVLWTACFGWWFTLAGGMIVYVALTRPLEIGDALFWVAAGLIAIAAGIGPFVWMRLRH